MDDIGNIFKLMSASDSMKLPPMIPKWFLCNYRHEEHAEEKVNKIESDAKLEKHESEEGKSNKGWVVKDDC